MNNHTTAYCPTWAVSMDLLRDGRLVDFGLLAEAILFYETVAFDLGGADGLAEFARLTQRHKCFHEIRQLMQAGHLILVDKTFGAVPVTDTKTGVTAIWNVSLHGNDKRSWSERNMNDNVRASFRTKNEMMSFCEAIGSRLIQMNSEDFGEAVEASRSDLATESRAAFVMQTIVDEIYAACSKDRSPTVKVTITKSETGKTVTSYSVDVNRIRQISGPHINFSAYQAMDLVATSNTCIHAAMKLEADLFMTSPMSPIVVDTFSKTNRSNIRTTRTIDELEARAEFPDIRGLINSEAILMRDVIRERSKAGTFRKWLQSGAAVERDALFAYTQEFSESAGLIHKKKKLLNIMPAVIGWAAEKLTHDQSGATNFLTTTFLRAIASKWGQWKPITFGQSLTGRVKEMERKKLD